MCSFFSPWGFSCQKTLYTISWKWTQMEYFSLQNFCHFLSAHVTGKVRCWIDISTIPLHCFVISYMSKSFLNCQMEVTFPKKVSKPYCNFRWISDIAFCKGISVHWFFFRFLIFQNNVTVFLFFSWITTMTTQGVYSIHWDIFTIWQTFLCYLH